MGTFGSDASATRGNISANATFPYVVPPQNARGAAEVAQEHLKSYPERRRIRKKLLRVFVDFSADARS